MDSINLILLYNVSFHFYTDDSIAESKYLYDAGLKPLQLSIFNQHDCKFSLRQSKKKEIKKKNGYDDFFQRW